MTLWSLGLFLCFFASAPVTISEQAQEKYNSYIPAISRLQNEYEEARMQTYNAKGWFWWFGSESSARVYKFQAIERRAYDKLFALQQKQGATVGLWSEYGIEEARALMWRTFYGSTAMAKRMTYWDMFFMLFRGFSFDRDEGIVSILLQILIRFIQNLVIGMVVGFFSFLFAIVDLIQRFSPNFFEGIIFFLLATLAIGSLFFTVIAGACGCCFGTIYTVQKAAEQQRHLRNQEMRRNLHSRDYYQYRRR